jgi:hypothetical protein
VPKYLNHLRPQIKQDRRLLELSGGIREEWNDQKMALVNTDTRNAFRRKVHMYLI